MISDPYYGIDARIMVYGQGDPTRSATPYHRIDARIMVYGQGDPHDRRLPIMGSTRGLTDHVVEAVMDVSDGVDQRLNELSSRSHGGPSRYHHGTALLGASLV